MERERKIEETRARLGSMEGPERIGMYIDLFTLICYSMLIKTKKVSLKHSDLSPNLLNVAEKSRPKRRFKEDIRKRKPASGKPSANTYSIAVRTNWKSPVLWAQIEEVVARVPKPWSPREITRALRKSSVLFSTLTEQVVGRWVEPGKSRWTEAVLGAVAKGYSPGGQNTRVGILVSLTRIPEK